MTFVDAPSSSTRKPPGCEFCKRPAVYRVGGGFDPDPILACAGDLAAAVDMDMLDQKGQRKSRMLVAK